MENFNIEDLSIYPELLEKNNYKKFSDPTLKDKPTYIGSWQKCIRNEFGKAYYINFNFHDMSYYYRNSEHHKDIYPYSWESELQFNTLDDSTTINVKIFSSKKNIDELEIFVADMFKKMNFQNYEYSDEQMAEEHKYSLTKEKETIENYHSLKKELTTKLKV